MNYCIVYSVTNSLESAKQIAHLAVKNKLAACVNIISNVTSVYEWNGEVCEDSEFAILFKTKDDLYTELESLILSNHPYDLPAVLKLPINCGFKDFLGWVNKNTK